MFDKLKKAFSSAAKSIGQKEITQKVLDDTLLDLQIALLESDVAQEVVDYLSDKLKKELLGVKLEKGQVAEEIIRSRLQNAVAEIFARAGKMDLVERIKAKKLAKAGPFVILFLGINGTGKTTTVAKVASLLRKSGISVVIAAGDTHRAGAIEQLTQHANILSLKVIAQRYGADPSAVGRDAVEHARKNYIDAVLIDTAGRMQTSKNLMDEMAKIVRVVKPDVKLFIGDALAGNDTINQAREFFQYTNFDAAILTKIDADAKGGAAISIAYITSRPIAYIGIGQGYDDIIPFNPDKFIESLFGAAATVSVEDLMMTTAATSSLSSMPKLDETAAAKSEVKEEEEKEQKIKLAAAAKIITKEKQKMEEEEKPPAEQQPAIPVSSPIGAFAVRSQQKTPAASNNIEASLSSSSTQRPKPVIVGGSEPKQEAAHEKKAEFVPAPSEEVPSQSSSVAAAPPPTIITTPRQEQEPKKKSSSSSIFGGLFGRKKKDDDGDEQERRRKKEIEKREPEEEEEKRRLEEQREEEKEKEDRKKRKEDKDTTQEEDKVIYLTDEDIEDLLK